MYMSRGSTRDLYPKPMSKPPISYKFTVYGQTEHWVLNDPTKRENNSPDRHLKSTRKLAIVETEVERKTVREVGFKKPATL